MADCGLIEAYWNVNSDHWFRTCPTKQGLIEAYWNVNIDNYVAAKPHPSGFNRSILKCK